MLSFSEAVAAGIHSAAQPTHHSLECLESPQRMSLNFRYKGVFITATDTSVGKTTVAAGLVGFLKKQGVDVGVMKPVASGAIECDSGKLISQDAEMLVKFSGSTDPWEWINPYCLATSVTPSLAARIEGVAIRFDKIKSAYDEIARKHGLAIGSVGVYLKRGLEAVRKLGARHPQLMKELEAFLR